MRAYQKRLVKWDWAEDGWVFSNKDYTICPSKDYGGYSELWSKDEMLSRRKTVDKLKDDADINERKKLRYIPSPQFARSSTKVLQM